MSHTVCLRSTDATRLEEGVYQWTLKSHNAKQAVTRCSLASLEMPMSQYSVEEDWSRIYVTERLVLDETRRSVVLTERVVVSQEAVVERTSGTGGTVAKLTLPMQLARLEQVQTTATATIVRTALPHGVTGDMLEWLHGYEEHCKCICTEGPPLDVSRAWRDGRLRIVDEVTLRLEGEGGPASTTDVGYLLFPSPPTPDALAKMVSRALAASGFGRRAALRFDDKECRFVMSLAAYPEGATAAVRVSVGGDALATAMGFDGSANTFERHAHAPRTAGYVSSTTHAARSFLDRHVVMEGRGEADRPPLEVTADAAGLFGHAALRPGWYAPSNRIYSTSPPLHMRSEIELQFARFVFPEAEQRRGIVFTDPLGVARIAELAPGAYSAAGVARFLTASMNQGLGGEYAFQVAYGEGGRFRFACATTGAAPATGLAFSIDFAHPRSIEAPRLGFEEGVLLEGADTYESSTRVAVPRTPFVDELRNLYQIAEVHGRRQFCLRPTAPPSVIGVAERYDQGARTLRLHCVTAQGQPAAHGMAVGRVCHLTASSGHVADGKGGVAHESAPLGTSELVVVAATSGVTTVDVVVSERPWLARALAEKQALRLSAATEPCSFCFSPRLAKTVGGERLGFEPRTVQWGLDGSVRTRGLAVGPFISPRVHALDHVDFVLLRLREGLQSTQTQYETLGQASSVFGKVCLTPTFRHERHLPVDVLLGGNRQGTFTVEVLNPDGSRYNFHGATWSLAVTFGTT